MGTLAAGIKEIFATAKTTGSNVMLCGNDGTPDGHMTMANLASVLGGLKEIGTNTYQSLESVPIGVYYYNTASGTPSFISGLAGVEQYGILWITNSGGSRVALLFEPNGSCVYFNVLFFGLSTFRGWHQFTQDLPSFYKNYADLSSLASALGVMPYVSQQNVSNIDSWFTYSLVYFQDTVPQVGTFPYDINVLVMTIPFQTTLGFNHRFTIQIAFSYNASKASIRFGDTISYGAWKEFIS